MSNDLEEEQLTKFNEIKEVSDMIWYLDDTTSRLGSTKYLYHYTTFINAIKIIKTKQWHLASAKYMNDKNEYEKGDIARWKNLFFASFMREDKESIGMWSMYAQPWEDGVKIAIPKKFFTKWIRETKTIYELIGTGEYIPSGRQIKIDKKDKKTVRISSVAYSNADSCEDSAENDDEEKIICGRAKNTNISGATTIRELTGYIKDMAWAYEKEVRIKTEFVNSQNFKRVAIDVPDYVINEMVISAGPGFKGDLEKRLPKEIAQIINTDKSMYYGKLDIWDKCRNCEYKNNI